MKVKTKIRFKDLKEDKIREIGEEFIISKERYEEILKVGVFVEEIEEPKEEEVKETAKKK